MNNNDVILSGAHTDEVRVFYGIDRTIRRLQVERNSFVHHFSYGVRCHGNRLPLWCKESIPILPPSLNAADESPEFAARITVDLDWPVLRGRLMLGAWNRDWPSRKT